MFFSRLPINRQRRQARNLLANPRAMHAAVESSFPPGTDGDPGEGRILWRVDENGHDVTLYVVSEAGPDLRHLQEQAGWETAPPATVDYTSFLEGLSTGARFHFRVAVNPVKSIFVQGQRGKVVPHVTPAQQLGWFLDRAAAWGFSVLPADDGDESSVRASVVRRQDRSFRKDDAGVRQRVTQRQAVIEGVLQVEDPAALRAALTQGMGRGKAYGNGLMTLARGR